MAQSSAGGAPGPSALGGAGLPHVGMAQGDDFKKAYFAGYMTNRLLVASLGRATEDDREYAMELLMRAAGKAVQAPDGYRSLH